ncbi:MIP/aquaporin family protein [Lichenicola sp.]|uniref:MIP/aquaporin family protein n=1 Tax=Lichenicola sp. TaxID=2804529 RepID=UPI003B000C4A
MTAAALQVTTRPDRPLSGDPQPPHRLHPSLYVAELVGTLLLVALGLSTIIALWGTGGPFASLPLAPGTRRFLNGLLFGSTGAALAYSPLGRVSDCHINPAMTFAFWLEGRLRWRDASCYVAAQLLGGALGAVCLLAWGQTGASLHWGATVPARQLPLLYAIAGEVVSTFLLVALIFISASNRRSQPFTPLVTPPLFAILSWCEGPVSGASANPARSFGPELVGWMWSDWWVYWLGPLIGAALAVAFVRYEVLGPHRPFQARLFHFGHHGGTMRKQSGS